LEPNQVRRIVKLWVVKLCKDTRGQDLLEYALMVGFVAITVAATIPSVSANVSKIFSKVSSTMSSAAAQT
jgi:Flp pilus assembly pilin Flp